MGAYKRANCAKEDAAAESQAAGVGVKGGTLPKRPPTQPPPFTLADLRRAVPEHCFERSYARSFYHLGEDLVLLGLLALGMWVAKTQVVARLPTAVALPVQLVLYPAWIFVTGTVLMGLWVIAHECGHQAFSPSALVNDTVGLLLHSALLVPYHGWRVSHSNHHGNTNCMQHDEVYIPPTREGAKGGLVQSTLGNALQLLGLSIFGWPIYLITNISGPAKYRDAVHDHFSPASALFTPRDFWMIIISDIALFAVLAAVGVAHFHFGFLNMLLHYWLPFYVCYVYFFVVTYLQHTDVYTPHYHGACMQLGCSPKLHSLPAPSPPSTSALQMQSGTGSVVRWRRWTAAMASGLIPGCIGSLTCTFVTTSSLACPSTTTKRQLRRCCPSLKTIACGTTLPSQRQCGVHGQTASSLNPNLVHLGCGSATSFECPVACVCSGPCLKGSEQRTQQRLP